MEENIEKFITNLSLRDNSIIAVVGAGASVASGLRTFRGEDGYYKGKFSQELASRYGFIQNPKLVWEWYSMRLEAILKAQPNAIHHSLVRLEESGLLELVITQNVDGLHRRAGQKKIVEVHGTILKSHCLENCGVKLNLLEPPKEIPVSCPCGSYQRPSVVWFGEGLNENNLRIVQDVLLSTELVLIIGTSGIVFPVASFPLIAKQMGQAKLVEFNPFETSFNRVDDLYLEGPAEFTLPHFIDRLIKRKKAQSDSTKPRV